MMAFTVTLYTNSADRRVVDKTGNLTAITGGSNVSCSPTEAVDMLRPTFVINYNANFLTANYLYCSVFDRYYYINEREIEIGKKIILHCEVDPLMSWKGSIKECVGCITRSESVGGPTFVPDNQLPVNPKEKDLMVVRKDFDVYTHPEPLKRRYFVVLQYSGFRSSAHVEPENNGGES